MDMFIVDFGTASYIGHPDREEPDEGARQENPCAERDERVSWNSQVETTRIQPDLWKRGARAASTWRLV